jgi:hypothetical protein
MRKAALFRPGHGSGRILVIDAINYAVSSRQPSEASGLASSPAQAVSQRHGMRIQSDALRGPVALDGGAGIGTGQCAEEKKARLRGPEILRNVCLNE